MRYILSVLLIIGNGLQIWGNTVDGDRQLLNPEKKPTPKYVSYLSIGLPLALVGYGLIARESPVLKGIDHDTDYEVREHLKVKIPLDDYFQYVPLVSLFALDVCGIKARHNWKDRLLLAGTAYGLMGIAVNTMKATVPVARPDYSGNNSFPSGHTAMAFTGAHLVLREYWDESPWIGVTAYGFATATGTLRVLNKKHWVSDVLTGAGVGILSAELSYRLLPLYHRMFRSKVHTVVLTPALSKNGAGFIFSYTF